MNYSSEPCGYDINSAFPKPHRKLFRTWFRRPRKVKSFAPPIEYQPSTEIADPGISAQWGEHILIEDYLLVLHRDGSTTVRRHLVTQLHSSEALVNWDEVIRSYDSRIQSYKATKANLYYSDGSSRKASSNLHKVLLPGEGTKASGRTVQLLFAPLRPGVIVELEEEQEDFSSGLFWPAVWENFFLETTAPCRRRRFTVAVAKPFSLYFNVHHGAPNPVERTIKDYHICTWELCDSEGIEIDEWTPPLRDFAPWIDVTTASTWAPFAAKFLEELEPGNRIAPEVSKLAGDLSAGKCHAIEKACAAYTYVTRTVRYGRPRSELEMRSIRGSNEIFQDLRGDCKDKSALLVQLLRAMGFSAHVAVILTGDAGRTPFLPSTRFNHAIVKLNLENQTFWLDAASGEFSFGELPPVDLGTQALLLNREKFWFEPVPNEYDKAFLEYREVEGRVKTNGDYEGTVLATLSGDLAAYLRMQLYERNAEHQQKVLQAWLGADYPGASGLNLRHDSAPELNGSISYSGNVHIPLAARMIERILLFQIPWAGKLVISGPMAQEIRNQPLMLPRAHRQFERHVIKLPQNYNPIAIPEAVRIEAPWGKYACSWKSEPSRLICERELHIDTVLIPSEDFQKFKDFWRRASWSDGAPLVLQAG